MTKEVDNKIKALISASEGLVSGYHSLDHAEQAYRLVYKAWKAENLLRQAESLACWSLCTDDTPPEYLCKTCLKVDEIHKQIAAILEEV